MADVYIVEACRSPIGKRGKGLAGPAGRSARESSGCSAERAGIDPMDVDQVVGGCVSQVGEQTFNIARIAWLSQGLPLEVASTTVMRSVVRVVTSGGVYGWCWIEDVVMSCGIEMMSRVPLGSAMKDGSPMVRAIITRQPATMGAAMIAEGIKSPGKTPISLV